MTLQTFYDHRGPMLTLLDELNRNNALPWKPRGPLLILAGAERQDAGDHLSNASLIANGVPGRSHSGGNFHQQSSGGDAQSHLEPIARAGIPPAQPWLSTFIHFARGSAARGGRRRTARDFAIYDDDDQLAAVKLAMNRLQIEDDSWRRESS